TRHAPMLRPHLRPNFRSLANNTFTHTRSITRLPLKRNALTGRIRTIYTYPSRPASLGARIWFRPDGTPRSKLKGIAIATLFGAALYSTWTTLLLLEDLAYENALMAALIHIQRVDYELFPGGRAHDFSTELNADGSDDVDGLADPRVAVEYFASLCEYMQVEEGLPQDALETFFDNVVSVVKDANAAQLQYDPAASAEDVPLPARIHVLVRTAARAVHKILAKGRTHDPVELAAAIIIVLDTALLAVLAVMEEAREEMHIEGEEAEAEAGRALREKMRSLREQLETREKERDGSRDEEKGKGKGTGGAEKFEVLG
ncbi:unnamed protein product, partial [Mycena citricolor]